MRTPTPKQTAWISLCVNVAYALYNGALGLWSGSWWWICLCAYYLVLSGLRFYAVRFKEKSPLRATGVLFVALAVCMVGVVILAVVTDRGVRYHEIVMITLALYAFTKVTLGIINLVKAKKQSSPAPVALRNISLADAFVSIFSLQRSMLVTFEGMAAEQIRLMNALTGGGVCLIILLLGINLIGGKRITMAKSKIVEANKKIADGVTEGYKKIEKGVVEGYKKIEKGVVEGYTKIEDKFVDQYLTREGETVEQAKARLKKKD